MVEEAPSDISTGSSARANYIFVRYPNWDNKNVLLLGLGLSRILPPHSFGWEPPITASPWRIILVCSIASRESVSYNVVIHESTAATLVFGPGFADQSWLRVRARASYFMRSARVLFRSANGYAYVIIRR